MLERFTRLVRSWLGFFISMGEDPEVMLQEAVEEMRATMPRLNQVLVATRATVIRLEEEKNRLDREERASKSEAVSIYPKNRRGAELRGIGIKTISDGGNLPNSRDGAFRAVGIYSDATYDPTGNPISREQFDAGLRFLVAA